MLFGDAKQVVGNLVKQLSGAPGCIERDPAHRSLSRGAERSHQVSAREEPFGVDRQSSLKRNAFSV